MIATSGAAASPWSRPAVAGALLVFVLGALLWVASWLMLSERPAVRTQIGPITLGVGGAAVTVSAQLIWVLAGRRAVRTRRRTLIGAASRRDQVGDWRPTAIEYVAGEELLLYHRPDCPLVPRESVLILSEPAVHHNAGRVPCAVCRP